MIKIINFLLSILLTVPLSSLLVSASPLSGLSKQETKNQDKKKIVFRVRKSALWFKHSELDDKKENEMVQISLFGELYKPPIKISEINKKEINRDTIEGLISSYFSASKKGDISWILENFIEDEKAKVKEFYEDKKNLKASKNAAKSILSEFISGKVEYKNFIILFIVQEHKNNIKVTEAVACKKTTHGWKLTNSLSTDKTFDIVFASLSNGRVFEEGGVVNIVR